MIVASSAAKVRTMFITSFVSRSLRLDFEAVMLTSTPRAPARFTPSSSGQAIACSAAMRARSMPLAMAEPIIAMPCSDITVRTSWKSTLTRPGLLMISAMPATALLRTSSAARNASSCVTSSPSTSSSLSLRITISESTCGPSSSMPRSAIFMRLEPSKAKGFVTTATVRIPRLLATSAMTGAAPVPVPPPMPAVMNTMCAPATASSMRSRSASATARASSGFAPAPRPLVPSWIWFAALLRESTCASVLTAMNSTPCTPSSIMWFTALPPAPPTPTTLMIGPLTSPSTISNMLLSPCRLETATRLLKVSLKPLPHAPEHGLERAALARKLSVLHLRHTLEQKPHRGGVARRAHDFGEAALVARQAQAHGHVEDLLAQLHHSLHRRGASGEHHAAREQLLEPRLAQHLLHERKQLLRARLDHLGERLARHRARRALADPRDLDHVGGVGELAQRHAVARLDRLGLRRRRAQRHRDVVGDLVARDRDHGGMPDRAVREDGDIGGAAADVEQAHAEVFLVLRQHRARGGEGLQDEVVHLQATAAHALHDVLRRRHRARDDMHLDLEAHARHADRLAHVLLAVDDELLAQHVQDLLVGGNVDRPRRVDRALDVERAHFAVLDGDHPGGIEAADVAAGDADEGRADLAVGHELGLLQRALDRCHRRLDVDDHALLQPLGLVAAHAQDFERAVGAQLCHETRHLRGPDVQRHDEVLVVSRHGPQPGSSGTRRAKPLG